MQVFKFYDSLSRLDAIKVKLIATREEQREEWLAAEARGVVAKDIVDMGLTFNLKAPALWGECESLVAQVLTEGNPLKLG